MNDARQYIQEDEIDLRELFSTIMKRKKFVVLFTLAITLLASIYAYTKNPAPIYSGNMMIEIGEVKSNNPNQTYFDNVNNLKKILEKRYQVSVTVPKKTNNLIIITSSNEDKELIKSNISTSVDFIMQRHQSKIKLYDKYIMTKQIGKTIINNTPINTPKKKLIVTVAFVTGFILSIFLVFFLEFIAKSDEDEKEVK